MSTERMEDNEIDIETQIGAESALRDDNALDRALAGMQGQLPQARLFDPALAARVTATGMELIRDLAAKTQHRRFVQPASWNIERGEIVDNGDGDGPRQEVLVQFPHGGGMWVKNQGPLAQRLLYALAMALTEPQTPLAPGDTAELFLELRASSGYSQRSRYTEVTPQQWGSVVGVLEGTTSTWRGDDIERQAFEGAAFAFYLRKREERAAKGQGIALDDPNTVAEREMMFRRHPNGDYIAHAYQQAWGGWRMARGGV